MTRYIIRRLIYVVVVMLAVTFVAFVIFFLLPSSDPAVAFAGRNPTPELVAQVEEQLGPRQARGPCSTCSTSSASSLGDEYGWPGFGLSYNTRSPVHDEIFQRAIGDAASSPSAAPSSGC